MHFVIVDHPYSFAEEETFLLKESAYLSCAKISVDESRFSLSRLVQRQVRDVEQETEERNIQQRSILHRNQSDHVESTD